MHISHKSSFLSWKGYCWFCGSFCLVDIEKVVEAMGRVIGTLTVLPYIMSQQYTLHAMVDSLFSLQSMMGNNTLHTLVCTSET
jgi:hypothetical protein